MRLIYYDQHAYNNQLSNAAKMKQFIENVIAEYNVLGIATALTIADFPQILTDPKTVLYNKITGGSLSLGGVPVIIEKAWEIIQKPEGVNDFINFIKKLPGAETRLVTMHGIVADFSNYTLADNVATFKADVATALADKYKYYAVTDNEIAAAEELDKIIAALTAIQTLRGGWFNPEKIFEEMLSIDRESIVAGDKFRGININIAFKRHIKA